MWYIRGKKTKVIYHFLQNPPEADALTAPILQEKETEAQKAKVTC